MQGFRDAVEIGAAHGLGVDMSMGSGWCFGGPQLSREEGCWYASTSGFPDAAEYTRRFSWMRLTGDAAFQNKTRNQTKRRSQT